MYDILIKNGTVIDGTSNERQKLDVAISNERIAALGSFDETRATKVIDATNLFVSPGFIDIQNHSDTYWTLFDQPEQLSLLTQGITTIIVGNCGSSLAPLPSHESIKTIQKWHELAGVNLNWTSFAEFLEVLRQKPTGVNIGSLVGHATLRRGLIGDAVKSLSTDEVKIMDRLLKQALEEGALGLSLGLVYAHEVNSTLNELIEVSKTLKSDNKYLSVHLRSEGKEILEAIDEVIEISKKSGVPIKISHLKIREKENWPLFDWVLNKLENAYHQGVPVSFDVYPYDSSWSVLYTYLPKWTYEGGRTEILKKLNSPLDRRKILDHLKSQHFNFENIIVSTAEENSAFIGKSIKLIAANQGISGEEAILNILSACKAQVIVFDHNLSNEQVELLISSPLSLVASDGAGYTKPQSKNFVHPRCFGAMPRFLKLVREKKLLTWEQAIKKITSEQAKLLGFKNRGFIQEDMLADLVIFDPLKISDRATYNNPFQFPVGIHSVIVNGKVAFDGGSIKGLYGEVIT